MRVVLRALAASALAAAFFSAAAPAAPSTSHLDALRSALETRRNGILPNESESRIRERAALTRALAAFEARSTSIDGDLRMLQKAVRLVEGFYTGDATPIPAQIDTAFAAFLTDTIALRDGLAERSAALVDAKVAARAQAGIRAADATLTLAEAAGVASARVALVRTALASIRSTAARVARATACRGGPSRPGRGYFAMLLDDVPFVPGLGSGAVAFEAGAPSEVSLMGYGAPVGRGGVQLSWSTGGFTGTGTYDLDGTSGAFVVVVVDGATFYSESGQVTVTLFDAAAKRVEGTFEGTLTSTSGARRRITKGTFAACYAARGT